MWSSGLLFIEFSWNEAYLIEVATNLSSYAYVIVYNGKGQSIICFMLTYMHAYA